MSRDLDTRARHAATALREAVESTELTSVAPMTPRRRTPLVGALRPALIGALLLIGSAVGVAVVLESEPPPTTVPPVTTTVPVTSSVEPVVPIVPISPTTTYSPPATTSTTEAGDAEPPHLEITFPSDGAHLETKNVTFRGTTEPGARVFAGKYEAEVDSSGNWQIALILNEGSNVARFIARDEAGNESTASVTVHYDPPTTTTTEKEVAAFKAYATFGSCSETPPYDIYHGEGEPGTLVEITSEYGSGVAEVNGEGKWEKKVIFEQAPEGTPFIVTVTDAFGRSKQFEFVYSP